MPRPDAILFDLDGCIIDSAGSIIRCWAETLPEFGLPVPPAEEIRPHVGPPVDVAARAFAPHADDGEIAQILATYRARSVVATDAQPFAGMPELLAELRERGWTLGLATSKSIEVVEPTLLRLGLAPLFTVIEGTRTDELGTDKATIVGRALTALAPIRPFAHVGDRLHDVEGAHAHGLTAIGVRWGYGLDGELEAAGADVVVDLPHDLAVYLRDAVAA